MKNRIQLSLAMDSNRIDMDRIRHEIHATELLQGLRQLGIQEIVPGVANFILFHLTGGHPDSETVINRCSKQGLFIRDAAEMGTGMGDRAIRIAVKDAETNQRMLQILGSALQTTAHKSLSRIEKRLHDKEYDH